MSIAEKRIVQLLKNSGFQYEIKAHEPVYTCEQAASARGEPLAQGTKCMLLVTNTGSFVMSIGPGNKRVDMERIRNIEGVAKVRLASEDDVKAQCGCEAGCVPPFGYPRSLKCYVDADLLKGEYINFSPGCHDKTIKMKSKDVVALINNQLMLI